ncbi:MAG: hypothetical protein WAU25_15420, partial [Nitrososphaeraceae archaeon]
YCCFYCCCCCCNPSKCKLVIDMTAEPEDLRVPTINKKVLGVGIHYLLYLILICPIYEVPKMK